MSEVQTTLNILIDALMQKKESLSVLEKLSKEQGDLLDQDTLDDQAFQKTINNKQVYIDKILLLDEGFKPKFERISGRLNHSPELYRDDIKQMKQLVKEVGELGINIEVIERRNKTKFDLLNSQSKEKVKTFKKSKQAVTNYYSSMNKQKADSTSYFFDSKK